MGSLPPSIDVFIPAFGRPDLLRSTVASALNQLDAGIQVTIVDDASADEGVRHVAREFETHGIRYIENNRNLGIGANFQQCADLARADYTVVMGSDDLFLPGYFAAIRQAACAFDWPDLVHPGVTVVDEAGRPCYPIEDRIKGWIRKSLVPPGLVPARRLVASLAIGNWLYFPAIAWRSDSLKRFGFRARYRTVLDLDLLINLAVTNGRALLLAQELFAYRRHQSSVSAQEALVGRRFEEEDEVLDRLVSASRQLGWREAEIAARLRPSSRLHRAAVTMRTLLAHTD